MYLEEYCSLKINCILGDKIKTEFSFLFCSTNLTLTYIITLRSKQSSIVFIILLLLLSLLSGLISKLKYTFIITLVTLYEIFIFLNKLILVLLPSCIINSNLFCKDYFSLNNACYFFNQFPSALELKKDIHLNKFYLKIIKEVESKLIIYANFINIFHKESLCHVLKLPFSVR